ncbi:MAG: B12-binding domain-containing radical SAM protein, partial [Candidatus Omnitrophica bacterium]|nr:B12-binding domain-containing radical SAM protein [Candidatus Omnitrophota bacterium]
MREPLKIYLGDLTYDTVAISANAFPLNIGYIGSFCIARFGHDIEVTLFKYIRDLEEAIAKLPPDILGLSNYCWNQNLGMEMFKILHKVNHQALTVWGGPNFPKDKFSQEKWLGRFSEADIYVPLEAEVGFSNIVGCALKIKSAKNVRQALLTKAVDGCIIRGLDGKFNYGGSVKRIENLDEIPSPYLNGILDKFFDGKLLPIIQTNRGCPFSCTYCVDGSEQVKKTNRFSVERVTAEIEYIAKRAHKKTHYLAIADLNFGMLPRDLQICDALYNVQRKYKYPLYIGASTGKNSKENIINAIKRLKGSLELMIAVQSMDEQVLKNINRENISVERLMELAPIIKESGLKTKAEVILGLPGDTYESHMNSLKALVDAEMDEILVFTCMLLPGSELFVPEERKKWNFKTKHRILPRDFAKLNNGKIVIETEECVVGSDTMTFDEYVELRLFNFIIYATNREIVYEPVFKFLKEQNIEIFKLFYRMLKGTDKASTRVRDILNKFKSATINELWDSREEIVEHYQNESEYKKLLNGEEGINVLYHYQALITAKYMGEWTRFVCRISLELLKEKEQFDKELNSQFLDVVHYCLGLSH